MNGLELHQRLAAARSRISIIFATAGSDESARRQAFQAGATDFLQKSFRDETLVQARPVALGDWPGRGFQRVSPGLFRIAASIGSNGSPHSHRHQPIHSR